MKFQTTLPRKDFTVSEEITLLPADTHHKLAWAVVDGEVKLVYSFYDRDNYQILIGEVDDDGMVGNDYQRLSIIDEVVNCYYNEDGVRVRLVARNSEEGKKLNTVVKALGKCSEITQRLKSSSDPSGYNDQVLESELSKIEAKVDALLSSLEDRNYLLERALA